NDAHESLKIRGLAPIRLYVVTSEARARRYRLYRPRVDDRTPLGWSAIELVHDAVPELLEDLWMPARVVPRDGDGVSQRDESHAKGLERYGEEARRRAVRELANRYRSTKIPVGAGGVPKLIGDAPLAGEHELRDAFL